MANKKLKKISKDLLKASTMHKGQAEKIKKMLKHGGYKSRYQAGGMYGDNTVASAGQGRPGATSSIVYQESDPKLQQQRIAGQQAEEDQLTKDIAEATAEAQTLQEQEEIDIANAEAESQQKADMTSSVIQTGLEGGKALGLLKGSKSVGSSVKDAVKAFRTARSANKAAQTAKNLKTGFDVARSSADIANVTKTGLTTGNTLSQGFQLGKTASGVGGTATQFGGTAANLGGAASTGSAVGAGLSALNNANVYAAAANYGGKAISNAYDDNDATTWTAGEGTGDVLSRAGQFAGYGAMATSWLGPGAAVGAVAGGIIGAGVGLYEGFAGRRKARKAETEAKAKQLAFKTKTDAETTGRFSSQLSRVKAGQLKQKTYSGYDLGRNVTAQMGGMRMGTPRYGYAA